MSINKLSIEEPALYSGKLNYVLFIFPVLYGFLLSLFYYQGKFFFTTSPDPVYAYLVNGTNIASGNFDIGHFDHPGTPVQWLVAVVVFITHLFMDGNSISQSVLSNPEFYLGACSTVLIVLLMLSVYASGRLTLKHTGNISISLFFQLIPISCYVSVSYLIRIMPEALLIIFVSYYATFLWVLCYKRNNFPDSAFSNKSFLLFFSFISALLITTKITCIPFMVIPLFFIKGTLKKFLFLITTFVFAVLIIYPVWSKLPQMFQWFNNLATHSSEYGQGKEEIIDKTTFLSNLIRLFTNELFFAIGYILISIVAIAGWVMKKWKDNFYKLTLALWIVCSVQLLLAAKHFGLHYIIPSQLLIIPGAIAACIALVKLKSTKLPQYSLLILCSLWLVFKSTQCALAYKNGNKIYESSLAAKKYADLPKVITTGYQGTCFQESALRFGSCYGGGHYYMSNYFLRKLYPNSYFFDLQQPSNYFKWWDIKVMPIELFEKSPKILFYFSGTDEGTEKKSINDLTTGFEFAVKSIDLVEYNKEIGERFYMLNIDTSKITQHYVEKIKIEYDFEKKTFDNSSFTSSDGKFNIGEANSGTTEKSFSGNNSIKISPAQYTCYSTFDVAPGDAFDVSVNYYSTDRPVGMILSATHPEFFDRNYESITEDYGNGWKRASFKAVVPLDFPERKLNFCLYYFGFKACYADDLKIVISKSGIKEEIISQDLKDLHKFILKAQGGNYLALNSDLSLVANQPDASKAEVFERIDLGNGKIALKASNGQFVCVDRSQKSRLIANRKIAGDWESLRLIGNDLKAINIKSSSGMFVCADHSIGDKVVADRFNAAGWETFEVIKK